VRDVVFPACRSRAASFVGVAVPVPDLRDVRAGAPGYVAVLAPAGKFHTHPAAVFVGKYHIVSEGLYLVLGLASPTVNGTADAAAAAPSLPPKIPCSCLPSPFPSCKRLLAVVPPQHHGRTILVSERLPDGDGHLYPCATLVTSLLGRGFRISLVHCPRRRHRPPWPPAWHSPRLWCSLFSGVEGGCELWSGATVELPALKMRASPAALWI